MSWNNKENICCLCYLTLCIQRTVTVRYYEFCSPISYVCLKFRRIDSVSFCVQNSAIGVSNTDLVCLLFL
jgi:hypothetical protein